MKLFMVLMGCKPAGRHTEQHDVFFGIAEQIKDLIPAFEKFWPEAKGKMHIDGYREVNQVNGYQVTVLPKTSPAPEHTTKLFFINLGGYKKNELEEFHYKMLVAADQVSGAIDTAKQTAFFKHTHFEGANSHIDDKYGIDVDDIYEIADVLDAASKFNYQIHLSPANQPIEDPIHLGYFKLTAL